MNSTNLLLLLNKVNQSFGFSNQTIEAINFYSEILFHWNKKINLIGHKTEKDFVQKSIYDCFLVGKYFLEKKEFENKKALDFGTGAGLPGIIIKLIQINQIHLNKDMNNNFDFHLVDSKQKKIAFLNYVNLKMKLDLNIHFLRVEKLKEKNFDWVISRATYPSNQKIINLLKPLLKKEGEIYLMKDKTEINHLEVNQIENIQLGDKKNNQIRSLIHIVP